MLSSFFPRDAVTRCVARGSGRGLSAKSEEFRLTGCEQGGLQLRAGQISVVGLLLCCQSFLLYLVSREEEEELNPLILPEAIDR